MSSWEKTEVSEKLPATSITSSKDGPLAVSLGDVETQLVQLLDELRGLQLERHASKPPIAGNESLSKIEWGQFTRRFFTKGDGHPPHALAVSRLRSFDPPLSAQSTR